SVIRSRRGLSGEIHLSSERGGRRSLSSLPPTTPSSGWLTSAETLGLIGWPLGADVPVGVKLGGARELLVPRHVPSEGRVLLSGRDAGGPRRIALSPEAQTHHLALVGPTGV